MKNRAILIAAMFMAIVACPTEARQERSEAAKNHFKHSHPCPSNGHTSGACPGYVIDHVMPIACGGLDDPSNMQWQTVAAGKTKDRWERRGCAARASSHDIANINRARAPEIRSGYYRGPEGGCFTYSARGKKRYVEHSYCG